VQEFPASIGTETLKLKRLYDAMEDNPDATGDYDYYLKLVRIETDAESEREIGL